MTPDRASLPEIRHRILVAEDEENLRSLLKLSLSRAYEVETAEDGLAALEAFESRPADMVILDIMMPRMDGLTACEQIRRRSEVPIIMLTALGSADDVVKGFNLGADDYITKPFTFKELIVRIEAVFRRLDWMQQPPPAQVIVNGELRVQDLERHDALERGVLGPVNHAEAAATQLFQDDVLTQGAPLR